MKVLIADKLPTSALSALEALGLEVTVAPEVTADSLPQSIGDHQVLVVRSTKVTREALEAARALELVVRAGAGVNTIDVATASRRGIFVANTPGKNAVAVAELALGLMLAVDRRIPAASAELRQGRWNKKEYSKADGLYGKTLGLLGLGQIGREVAVRARALGLRVVGWSRSLTAERAAELGIEVAASPGELAKRAQIVSIHLAHAEGTKNLIDRSFLQALPEGAIVINTSRGGIVDEEAMLEAVNGGVRYATDVFDGEPGSGEAAMEHALAQHPNVIGTPHIGASTSQSQMAVAEETVRVIRTFLQRGVAPNCVNLCERSPATFQLTVRHFDRVGVLAAVLDTLREAGINVEEVENIIFDGAEAAYARIQLAEAPSGVLLEQLERSENILGTRLVAL